ncbi:MAG: hypothetical protein WD187_03485 [Candidatus Woykebacteria bacterium]
MPDQFGSFFPIWDWHPALVGFFVFVIDFGVIMTIRIYVERKLYFLRWWSFKVGDTIGLPVYAGFAAAVVSDGEFSGFYTEIWWHIAVLVVGYAFFMGLHVNNLRTGFFSWSDAVNASEVYHTVIAGVMFYLMVTVLPAVLESDGPSWQAFIAGVGLSVYVFAWFIDQTPLVDKTRGRILPNELVINLR